MAVVSVESSVHTANLPLHCGRRPTAFSDGGFLPTVNFHFLLLSLFFMLAFPIMAHTPPGDV